MGYIQVATWVQAGQRQAAVMRLAYFRALLRQEIGWYDRHASGELTTQIAESLPKIQAAISDKVCLNGWCTVCIIDCVNNCDFRCPVRCSL